MADDLLGFAEQVGRDIRDLTAAIQVTSDTITLPVDPESGWTGGMVMASRRAGMVTITARALTRGQAETSTVTVATLPPGWRPTIDLFGTSWRSIPARVRTSGEIQLASPSASMDYFSISFLA